MTKSTYNTNSQSPASKAARMKAAHEHDKKLRELGLIKNIGLRLPTEVFNDFDGLAKKHGVTRTECLRMLLNSYHKYNN